VAAVLVKVPVLLVVTEAIPYFQALHQLVVVVAAAVQVVET
jgi:hypothetical protein